MHRFSSLRMGNSAHLVKISETVNVTSPMKTLKQIPCGDVRFEELRSGSFAYVDKTRYIEELENCGARFALIVRPRG